MGQVRYVFRKKAIEKHPLSDITGLMQRRRISDQDWRSYLDRWCWFLLNRFSDAMCGKRCAVTEEQIDEYFCHCIAWMEKHGSAMIDGRRVPTGDQICNIDGTGVQFDRTFEHVIAMKGQAEVKTAHACDGQQNLTIVPAVWADGERLSHPNY